MKRKPAVLLDRDGTLVHDDGYMSDPSKLRLLRNAVNGVKRFVAMGYVPVVVTNQSGVGRGYFTKAQLDAMHRRLTSMLAQRGVKLAGIYACIHHPDDDCGCRKPKPGLLTKAARDLGLDLKASVMVGDTDRDTGAGQAVGATTICLTAPEGVQPDYVAVDLLDAARWIERRTTGDGRQTADGRRSTGAGRKAE